jgi:hypothetical protein
LWALALGVDKFENIRMIHPEKTVLQRRRLGRFPQTNNFKNREHAMSKISSLILVEWKALRICIVFSGAIAKGIEQAKPSTSHMPTPSSFLPCLSGNQFHSLSSDFLAVFDSHEQWVIKIYSNQCLLARTLDDFTLCEVVHCHKSVGCLE